MLTTIHRALDLGLNFLDTADMYGCGENEELVGQAIKGRRAEVILATKFGNVRDAQGKYLGVSGRPEYVRQCCDASLQRLGVEQIDRYIIEARGTLGVQMQNLAHLQNSAVVSKRQST